MAAKTKKKSERTRKGAQASYRAVLYGVGAETAKGQEIRNVFEELGIPLRIVGSDRLGDSVGSLAGCVGMHPSKKPYAGAVPECEFLLLCNLPNALLNTVLVLMKQRDCSVGCKATLTSFNRLWPFATLIENVSREHAAMTAQGDAAQDLL